MSKLVITVASSPGAIENFDRSVVAGVPPDQISTHPAVGSFLRELLNSHSVGGRVRAWGSVGADSGRHATTWRRIEPGDWIVFSVRGRFTHAARIFATLDNASVADAIWDPDPEAGSYRYITFFDAPLSVDVTPASMSAALGYGSGFIFRGFLIPATEAQSSLADRYGSIERFLGVISSEIDAADVLVSSIGTDVYLEALQAFDTPGGDTRFENVLRSRLTGLPPEVIDARVKRIKRDRELVRELKDLYQGGCQRCGFTFLKRDGTPYSEAAHLTPVSSLLAGVDSPDNIVILCANCHRMLDHGGLSIYWDDGTQVVTASLDGTVSPLMANRHIRQAWSPSSPTG